MRVDAHVHFWKYNTGEHDWITDEMKILKRDFMPQDLEPLLRSYGIDGCVAVQAAQTESETNILIQLALLNPFIKGVVGWIDLRREDVGERLSHFCSTPVLKGFRHIVQSESKGFLEDKNFIRGVNRLDQFGLTYDLLIYHFQIPEALEFVNKVRNVKVVVDHMAKPSIRTGEKTHWELNMAALATFENVYCKISGMVTEAHWHKTSYDQFEPYLDEVFECFGTRRVMYGSDWPVCLLAGSYETQLSIVERYIQKLSESEKDMVMGGNAERFYKL